jgi:GT2 family glycosyltransferase
MNLPGTSLLICSRNRPQMLWETIQSILSGAEIPSEMVIIDQSDEPNAILSAFQPERACSLRYLWSEQKGVSLGRNRAVAVASHHILVLTDDDMLVTPSWFGSLVRALLVAGPHTVITGRVLSSKEGNGEGFTPSTRQDTQAMIYKGRVSRDVLFTNNMAIYRSAFDHAGGFDTRLGPGTRYPAAEDNDLAFRLLEAGYCIKYDPEPTLYHRAWRSIDEFLRLQWDYGYGQGAFYAKYFSVRDPYMIKRFTRDLWAYLARVPFRLFRHRNQAYQDAFFGVGVLYGAFQWCLNSQKDLDG